MATKKSAPSWSDIKAKLADFDRAGLIGLVQDLYATSEDNQAFLRARFGLGDDVLKTYKTTIDRWLWPDVFKNQDTSVAKAKKAIVDYKKAIGKPDGLAELMVFYCERAAGFSNDVGLQDEGYFDALVRMFEQALKVIAALPNTARPALLDRLDECHHVGAVSFDAILKRTKAKYVLGLTATPIRRDGQQPIIFMQCGPIRYTAAKPAGAPHDLDVLPRTIVGSIFTARGKRAVIALYDRQAPSRQAVARAGEYSSCQILPKNLRLPHEHNEHIPP